MIYENRKRDELEHSQDGNNQELGGFDGRVDWHDFVIVETIQFAKDEIVEALPPPVPVAIPAPVLPPLPVEDGEDGDDDDDDRKDDNDMDEESSSGSEEEDDEEDVISWLIDVIISP